MIVYFIRHGETDYNRQRLIQGQINIPLNDNGIHQAEAAAVYFKEENIKFDRVYASPLIRAHKTASVVSGWEMEKICTDARVQELSFGKAEGIDYLQAPKKIRNLFTQPQYYEPAEGAETLTELKDRCQSFLDDLVQLEKNEPSVHTVLVASHGAALRGLLSCIDKCPIEQFWKKGLLNCCVAKTHLENGEWILDSIENPIESVMGVINNPLEKGSK